MTNDLLSWLRELQGEGDLALEIHRSSTEWMYRIDEADDRHIQRRKLARGSRWEHFRLCESAEMAREVILVMQEELPQ